MHAIHRLRTLPSLLLLAASLTACTVGGEPDAGGAPGNAAYAYSVDHEPLLPPVRDQGVRGTCTWFAWTAAVESYYGLKDWLSVEQMGVRLGTGIDFAMNWRVLGVAMAPESYWPYNGTGQPGLDQSSVYGIGGTQVLAVDEEQIKTALDAALTNNVVLMFAYDRTREQGGVFVNPQLGDGEAAWLKLSCNYHDVFGDRHCGGHAVLLVGYETRVDSDGAERTFFKFRNSWGPGYGQNGYGWMSAAYLTAMATSATMITDGTVVAAAAVPRFCPKANVNRHDMARYLELTKHRHDAGWAPATLTSEGFRFDDYSKGAADAPFVYQLLADKVTTGCVPGQSFCPDDAVPREQMAAFLVRMKYSDLVQAGHEDLIPIDDPADLTRFEDVTGPGAAPERRQFARYIARLYEDHITTGRDATHFDPTALVPREEMATFLMRYAHPDQVGHPPAPTGRFADITDPNSQRDFAGFIEEAVGEGVMEACSW